MNVCQILYSGLGGHGSVAFSLVEADADRSWQHSMIFAGIEPVRGEYEAKCATHGVAFRGVQKKEKNPLPFWRDVKKALNDLKPDAVVLHSNTLVLPVWRWCRSRDALFIGVEHQANRLKTRTEKIASRLFMLLTNAVVVLTDSYREELQKLTGRWFRPEKTRVIPNGIDTGKFSPAHHRADADGRFRLGMAGRFTSSKDQEGLARNFAALVAGHPEYAHCTLELAGDGERWNDVRKAVRSLGAEHYIHLPGNLDEPALVDFYRRLDLYVHASAGETMSTAIMQALSCGIPTLASDVPGISNMLRHGTTGMLYDFSSPEHFTARLTSLLEDVGLRERLSAAGRASALQHYSQERMFAAYDNLLSSARR